MYQLIPILNIKILPGVLLEGDIEPTEVEVVTISDECKCINGTNNAVIKYHSEGVIYFLNSRDVNLVIKYQLNPYTGLQVTDELLDLLGLKFKELDLDFCGDPNRIFTEESVTWLKSYYIGDYMNHYTSSYFIPPSVRMDFVSTKPCSAITVYRGFTNIFKLEPGTPYPFKSLVLSSWSYNIEVARAFAQGSEYEMLIIKLVVDPADIFIDTTMINAGINDNRIYPTNQEEVILIPGNYECIAV